MLSEQVPIPGNDMTGAEAELLSLLYALVVYCRPHLIVEAGTYRGLGAVAMATAVRDHNMRAHVWTADVRDYGQAARMREHGVEHLVTCCQCDFTEMLTRLPRVPDFAFVDSGAVVDEDGTLTNTEPALRLRHFQSLTLAPGGLIAVDDTASEWPGRDEIVKHGLTLPVGRGVTLVRR